MKVGILDGGMGTRLQEETASKPKPMVEIGGRPIVWHIMRLYSSYGYKEFLLALGYKGDLVKEYFLKYYYLRNSFSIQLANGQVDTHDAEREDWTVHLIDTGISTQTGGRIKRLTPWLSDGTFMLTYGDGVADID